MSAVTKASTPIVVEIARPARLRDATPEEDLNEVVKSGDLKAVQAKVEALEQQQKMSFECYEEAVPVAAALGYLEVLMLLMKYKGQNLENAHRPIHFGPALCGAAANGRDNVVQWILKEKRLYEGQTTTVKSKYGVTHIVPQKTATPAFSFQKVHADLKARASFIVPDDLLQAVRAAALHTHISTVRLILSENKKLRDLVSVLTKQDAAANGLKGTAALAYVLLHDQTLPPSNSKDLDDKTYLQFTYVTKKPPYNGVHLHLKHGNAAALPGLVIRKAAEKGDLYVIEAMMVLKLPLSEADRGIAVQNAAENGYVEIVRLLLGSGNISDRDRDLAVTKTEKSHPAIVELLQNNPKAVIEKALEMGHIKL